MAKPIRVRNAPGLNWREYAGDRWEARWRCRADIRDRGYPVGSVRLWIGGEPTKEEWDFIADSCNSLQQEMLVWANGGVPSLHGVYTVDGTLRSLITCYRTDPDSKFKKKRYASRRHYEHLLRPIELEYGELLLNEIRPRVFYRWCDAWNEGGKTAIGRAKITMLRILFNYGASILEDADCLRLATALSNMTFETPKPRVERLTSDQVVAIRAEAHRRGRPSVALAQAFQFECMFRQKDVLGEWVPISEPGVSDVFREQKKWLRGIRWEYIDANLILRHTTSKRDKPIVVDLKNAPMVLEELEYIRAANGGELPTNGPIVIAERFKLPWNVLHFRHLWREYADACGIPKTVRNMDSRAGAITEASDGGALMEHIRHAATHSDIATTQGYSRNSEDKIVNVQKARIEFRNKPKTT